jgi:hypothetical protein
VRKKEKAASHKATKSTNLPCGRQGFTKKKLFAFAQLGVLKSLTPALSKRRGRRKYISPWCSFVCLVS